MDEVRAVTLGHVCSIEAKISGTPDTPTLHAHAHCGVMVDERTYFHGGVYKVHQRQWVRWWNDAARVDPSQHLICDIKAMKGPNGETDPQSLRRSFVEVCKYAIAPKDLYHHSDDGISVDPRVALALYTALRGKRLVTYDRCFKRAEKRLSRKAKEAPGTNT